MMWVAVCDGAIAKVFLKENRSSSLHHLKTFKHSHELTHEHGRDKPGRTFESAMPAHHAYEQKNDWHEYQKQLFIEQVSIYLLNAYHKGKFSKLCFICPSKLVSIFKKYFEEQIDKQYRKNLHIIEIHKDLTHNTIDEIDMVILKEEGW